ncbi:hypothetical protein TNCV_1387881 [Trichonephila clavipes]|nr:hypothetical protein TNCV_1387881 [Trichonephila clavipes]
MSRGSKSSCWRGVVVWRGGASSGVVLKMTRSITFVLLSSGTFKCGCGSRVVKVSDHGWFVTNSSPLPLKTRRIGERCTLDLSRAQTSSSWCGAVVGREGATLKLLSRWQHFRIVRHASSGGGKKGTSRDTKEVGSQKCKSRSFFDCPPLQSVNTKTLPSEWKEKYLYITEG